MSFELNNEFRSKPLEFFKKYPVVPPHDLGQKLTNLSTIFDEATLRGLVSDTDTKTVTGAEADPTDRIRWVDFKRTSSMNEPDALTFSGSKAKVEGHVPIYFLPWRSMHLVSMKLSELSGRDYDAPVERNPNLFFTAAINGCSVFVQGGPTAPEVFHGGINGKLSTDAAQFWRDCLAEVVVEGGVRREVNKANYIKDTAFRGRADTPMAAEYMTWLEDQHRDRLTISEVSPWGCVFGIRYGRLWSFYLQENATVTTLEFVKKQDVANPSAQWPTTKVGQIPVVKTQEQHTFLKIPYKKTVYAARRRTTRPMRVSEFYPGGTGRWVSEPVYTKVM